MKTAVLFYSLSGTTRKIAQQEAAARNADLFEIMEPKKRGMMSAFFVGCPSAMRQKPVKVLASPVPDLSDYHTIIIAAPIWAGFPAPVFNNIIAALPSGKEIELIMVSASGDSSKSHAKVRALVEQKDSKIISYRDIRSAK